MVPFEDPSPRLPLTSSEQRWTLACILVLAGLFGAELLSAYSPVKAAAFFLLLFWVPMLVLHEVGHALAARWVGWDVEEVVIGFGRELTRFRVYGTLVRVRVLPVEGYVVPTPRNLESARLKSAFIFIAGPGIELLVVLLLWLVLGEALTTRSDDYGVIAAQSLALAGLMGAFFNLLPYTTDGAVSDGLGALLSLFASEDMFRQRLSSASVREARRLLYLERWQAAATFLEEARAKYPEDELLNGLQAVATAGLGNQQAAIDSLEALGHPNDKPALVRHDLLLDAAWVVLIGGQTHLLHDAQQACERASFDAPNSVRSNLMLGRVLLERDQNETAFKVLLHSYRQHLSAEDEAQVAAYLVVAARRTERTEVAERFLSTLIPKRVGPTLRAELWPEQGAAESGARHPS